jgi:hypothetical protein
VTRLTCRELPPTHGQSTKRDRGDGTSCCATGNPVRGCFPTSFAFHMLSIGDIEVRVRQA